ncbi:MAG: glutamate--tRNA ligase [bacterium]|nr:glutamate--tRNA ligase [bacterium]
MPVDQSHTSSPSIRVRFAPSPTGLLHVGGARTALFNWLFARHSGGTFILRIEDTDRTRFDANALRDILDSLRWLGLNWDEGPDVGGPHAPYLQSERLHIYREHAQQLLASGHAYYCFCSPERLDSLRSQQSIQTGYDRRCRNLSTSQVQRELDARTPYVIRFKMPLDGTTDFHDLIRGPISYPNTQQDDFVLLKTDGFPTYHLANVVDDHLMRISHVLRGEEWIPSTPKHVRLYDAFGWSPPVFAHLPVILAPGGGKLSKRHGAAAVAEYRALGYLPDALVNFLALLGWSLGPDRELASRDELIREFSLENVSKTAAQFNHEKLNWMNATYIRSLPLNQLAALVWPYLAQAGLVSDATPLDSIFPALKLAQERMQLLSDAVPQMRCFLADEIDYDPAAVKKFLSHHAVASHLRALMQRFAAIPDSHFTPAYLEPVINAYVAESGQSLKHVVHPLRVAVTGKAASPGIFETLACIGKRRTIARIAYALEHFAPTLPQSQ